MISDSKKVPSSPSLRYNYSRQVVGPTLKIPKNSKNLQFWNFSILIWLSYSLWKREKEFESFPQDSSRQQGHLKIFQKITIFFPFLNLSIFIQLSYSLWKREKAFKSFPQDSRNFSKKPSIICRSKTCFSTTGFTFSSTAQAVETAQVEQVSTSKGTSEEVKKQVQADEVAKMESNQQQFCLKRCIVIFSSSVCNH